MASEIIMVGPLTRLYPVDSILEKMHLSHRRTATQTLKALKVPIIHIGNTAYFSIDALDKALYLLARLGGRGFAAPGSTYKGKHLKKDSPTSEHTELPEDLMTFGESTCAQIEMEGLANRHTLTIKKTARRLVRSKEYEQRKSDDAITNENVIPAGSTDNKSTTVLQPIGSSPTV